MGDPAGPALAALVTKTATVVPSTDIADDGFIRTRLSAVVRPDAAVATVNAALLAANARVDGSSTGLPFLTLRIPAVTDLAAARAVAATLRGSGAFWLVSPAREAATDLLSLVLPPSGDSGLSHLVPSRLPAAWNVKALATTAVRALVPDFFHHTNPVPAIGPLSFRPAGRASAGSNHGFHVAGILGADHDASAVTGVFPHPSRLDLLGLPLGGVADRPSLLPHRFPATGTFVLSTSLNHPWDGTAAGRLELVSQAFMWRILVAPHTSRFLHLTSAGNRGRLAAPANQAVWNSEFTVAARHDDLRPLLRGIGLPAADSADFEAAWAWLLTDHPAAAARSPNVLLVGSSDRAGAESDFSSRGADLRAVGDRVYAPCVVQDARYPADAAACNGTTARYSGTSMSTPLVAGIAAYLWSLAPTLSPVQLKTRLQDAYDSSPLPGVLDAYHAVLRLDDGLASAPIRRELLDVAGADGRFDEDDLTALRDAFAAYHDARAAAGTPDAADHSRYDLNGDGLTGDSTRRAPFDLNANGVVEVLVRTINDVELTFDEAALSDFRILCYYGYSSLYQGGLDVRRDALPCVPEQDPPPEPDPVPQGYFDAEGLNAVFFLGDGNTPSGPCQSEEYLDGPTPLDYSRTTQCTAGGNSLTAKRVARDRATGSAYAEIGLTGTFESGPSGTFSGSSGARSTHFLRVTAPGRGQGESGSLRPVVRIKLTALIPAVPTSCTGGHLASARSDLRFEYPGTEGAYVYPEFAIALWRNCGTAGSTTGSREETVVLPPMSFGYGIPVDWRVNFYTNLLVVTNQAVSGKATVEYRIVNFLDLPEGAVVETHGTVRWPEPPPP